MKKYFFTLITILSFSIINSSFAKTESNAFENKAQNILQLKTSSNDPKGDYFIGNPEELKSMIQSFVKDNSKLDAAYLYIAANTAFRLGQNVDAGFLFYAAQIRKAFDTQRYNLAEPNGNNIRTYLAFLNDTVGHSINPVLMANPKDFSQSIDLLENWKVIPEGSPLYKDYGKLAVQEKDWPALAKSIKEDFMNNFGRKMKKFFSNPKNAEAFKIVQDYNFKKIPHNPENQKKYEAAMEILVKNGVQ